MSQQGKFFRDGDRSVHLTRALLITLHAIVIALAGVAECCEAPASKPVASPWVASDDGKLSLRLVLNRSSIAADRTVKLTAEFRNDSQEDVSLFKPFFGGVDYWVELFKEDKRLFIPEKRKIGVGTPGHGSFTSLRPGEVFEISTHIDRRFEHFDTLGDYKIRLVYQAKEWYREAGKLLPLTIVARIDANERLVEEVHRPIDNVWVGRIETAFVPFKKYGR